MRFVTTSHSSRPGKVRPSYQRPENKPRIRAFLAGHPGSEEASSEAPGTALITRGAQEDALQPGGIRNGDVACGFDDDGGHELYADPASGGNLAPLGLTAPLAPYAYPIPKIGEHVPVTISLSMREGDRSRDRQIAEFAEELLNCGVLKESDYDGSSVERSMQAGILRWLNHDLGARHLKLLDPLSLIYTNDGRNYFEMFYAGPWLEQFGGPITTPVGFFALSWTAKNYLGINVSAGVQCLEDAFPSLGYMLMDFLGFIFQWTIHGIGFDQAYLMVEDEGQLLTPEQRYDPESTAICPELFYRHIPSDVHSVKFDPPRYERALKQAEEDKTRRKFLPLFSRLSKLMKLLDDCSRTHVGCDHTPLLQNRGRQIAYNGSIYLRWSDQDMMARMVDDMHHAALFRGELPPTCWIHAFQAGHPGRLSQSVERHRKAWLDALKMRSKPFDVDPAMLLAAAKDFPIQPDGSIAAAVASVKRVIEMLVELDWVLCWLAEGI